MASATQVQSFREMLGEPTLTASPKDSTLIIIDAQNEYVFLFWSFVSVFFFLWFLSLVITGFNVSIVIHVHVLLCVGVCLYIIYTRYMSHVLTQVPSFFGSPSPKRYAQGHLKTVNVESTRKAIASLLEKYRSGGGDGKNIVHVVHKVPDGLYYPLTLVIPPCDNQPTTTTTAPLPVFLSFCFQSSLF